jgi:hypothetical protein
MAGNGPTVRRSAGGQLLSRRNLLKEVRRARDVVFWRNCDTLPLWRRLVVIETAGAGGAGHRRRKTVGRERQPPVRENFGKTSSSAGKRALMLRQVRDTPMGRKKPWYWAFSTDSHPPREALLCVAFYSDPAPRAPNRLVHRLISVLGADL